MSDAGVKKVSIRNLNNDSENILIVGIIIAKRSPRCFNSKRDGRENGVWGFTLRDTPADYINVTVWGSPTYVSNLASMYSVGDVIDIVNPRVSPRRVSEAEDKFQPPVTSYFELNLSEDRSELCLHDEDDVTEYKKLLFLPTKPPSNFLTLNDVASSKKSLAGQFVNLLVAVQRVMETREIVTKDGRTLSMLEMFVMDRSDSGFYIQSWNQDSIDRSHSWKPRTTVLFISDVKVEWDGFKKRIRGSLVDRTVLTENPRTKEAALLTEYLKTAPQATCTIPDIVSSFIPTSESITNVMSCQSVIKKALSSSDDFTALVYATLTTFDFDSDLAIVDKCGHCGQRAEKVCKNEECPNYAEELRINTCFDLKLKLTDHTGQLVFCRLSGRTAEKILDVTMEDYMLMNDTEKLNIKWRFLLKPVSAKLFIKPSENRDRLAITVVDLEAIPMSQFTLKMPVF